MKWTEIDYTNFKTLPRFGEKILAVDMKEEKPVIDILVYFGDYEWSSYTCNTFFPTHWMYFPELPELIN